MPDNGNPFVLADASEPAWLAAAVDQLIVRPVTEESVAMAVARTVRVSARADRFAAPIVAEDPTAAWTAEATEIDPSKPTTDQTVSPFFKLAGLTKLSNESADDTDPEMATIVGQGLARDIAKKVDASFFGEGGAGQDPEERVEPSGLEALDDVTVIEAPAEWVDLDPFHDALAALEDVGAVASAFVANPTDALAIAKLKERADSNRGLIEPDATAPGRRQIAGTPLRTSRFVTPGHVWALPVDRVLVGIRRDVELARSTDAYFSSDVLAIRAIMRVAFLWPHPAAIVRISAGNGEGGNGDAEPG